MCVCVCVVLVQACVLDCHHTTLLLWHELIIEQHFCQLTKQKTVLSLSVYTCSLKWVASEH